MLMPCRDAALKLQPGVVDGITTRTDKDVYYYVFSIRAPDGTRKLIACDAATGEVVKPPGRSGD
jgi:uncharacterized membrane protein YkoI